MTDFIIKKLPYDPSFNAGLALVGKYLKTIKLGALVDSKFPVRSGAANSDITTQAATLAREIAFIIKWNPRSAPVESIAAHKTADTSAAWHSARTGKRECLWTATLGLAGVGSAANPARRIFRLTERTIDRHGNALLLPEFVLEGWTTTLPSGFTAEEVIALYCAHATHEQFGKTPSQHSEFKSDMDLERLPSGKFDTNYLVCALAAVAMNLLRLIGQHTLNEPDGPLRHGAKRWRIKTVLQEMMFKAARWVLGLGANDSGFAVFERHYARLNTG